MFLNKINFFVLNRLAKVSRLLFLICLSFLFMLSACGDSSTDTDMDPIDNGGGEVEVVESGPLQRSIMSVSCF